MTGAMIEPHAPDQEPAELPARPELAAVAATVDAELSGQAVVPGQEPPRADPGAEVAAMLQMAVALLAPALPFVPDCYPPETCRQIGTAFAAVAEKRGWKLDLMASPELALAVVAIPPTINAVMQGRAHFAALRAERDATEQSTRPAPRQAPMPAASAADGRLLPGA